ncbi:MAG TPA: hypothetical protein VF950_27555 [Planctomycetota bacterium]
MKVFFVGPIVDFLLIGGLSILGAMGCLALDRAELSFDAVALVVALGWIVNWPHFAATSFRLYRSRESMLQYPATSFGVPLLVLAGVACAFAWPRTAGMSFVKLFMLWSPYHFAGQTLGLTLLYARRAGLTVGRLDRAAYAGFIFATYLWLVVSQEAGVVPADPRLPSLRLPEWMSWAALAAMHVLGLAALAAFARACLTARRLWPPIILLPAVAQYVWFVAGSRLESFNLFVPFFHSLQYLLIAWAVQLKERRNSTLPWYLINVAVGALLFWVLPRAVHLLSGVPLPFTALILGAAVQIHHFFVDGVIWKLRNPRVDALVRA